MFVEGNDFVDGVGSGVRNIRYCYYPRKDEISGNCKEVCGTGIGIRAISAQPSHTPSQRHKHTNKHKNDDTFPVNLFNWKIRAIDQHFHTILYLFSI